ncbi:hypothetical protein RJ640_026084 [Escallonia rubra]|uniref:Pentatricopeptide repeat-containing protein n=1 Tax=Escallonia rubra TaxID=112253 RepID=A0AA88RGP6_9ASTE|nr:hypothetical protein RJ640_026084 [Escallonia rubra]
MNTLLYDALIRAYLSLGQPHTTLLLFMHMLAHQALLNNLTFHPFVKAACSLPFLAKPLHADFIKLGVYDDPYILTSFLSTYSRLGDLYMHVRCLMKFLNMVVKEVCVWNALISALALNCKEKDPSDMFEKMKVAGLRPNGASFVAVLASCARFKLKELGLELLQSMSHVFGVVPRMEHYGCVVDLLGRAGLLAEANEFIKKMPFEPDGSVLRALLGACKVHGAIELGNKVARRLLHLQPRHCGQYVLLWGIYAGAERWNHATALRKTMIDAGMKKIPTTQCEALLAFSTLL